MIVQRRLFRVRTIIVSKIESHIKEHVSRLYVNLHLRCGEAVDKPVQRVVLSYAVIDKFGVVSRDGRYTERLARPVILQHLNLKQV